MKNTLSVIQTLKKALEPFDHFSFYSKFRDDSEDNYVMVNRNTVKNFLKQPENFHLLDGWTVDGNPTSKKRPTTYMAYWNAIKNGWASGLVLSNMIFSRINAWKHYLKLFLGLNDRRRRRRSAAGKMIDRDFRKRRHADHHVIHELYRFRRFGVPKLE